MTNSTPDRPDNSFEEDSEINLTFEWQRRRDFAVQRCERVLKKLEGEKLQEFLKEIYALCTRFDQGR